MHLDCQAAIHLERRWAFGQENLGPLTQAQTQFQPWRRPLPSPRTQHPQLALTVRLEIGPEPFQADLNNRKTLSQTGQRIKADRRSAEAKAGAIKRSRSQARWSNPQTTPTQPLIGAQGQGMAHHPTHLALQHGLPVGINLFEGQLESPVADSQTNGRDPDSHCRCAHGLDG